MSEQLFGLPFNYAESEIVVLPVPWEATVSYRAGTAAAPMAILKASHQVDLYDSVAPEAWKRGIYMLEQDEELRLLGLSCRKQVLEVHEYAPGTPESDALVGDVNKSCRHMVDWVHEQCQNLLEDDKQVVLLGGDHSTPLGYLQALASKYKGFGILQIDAHADLRKAYEGFEYSHASIMHNALKINEITSLAQIGIRDYCEEEREAMLRDSRVNVFFDKDIKADLYQGATWHSKCEDIVESLPKDVYVSFDIDGLKPYLCPGTGTPVAGGFETEEILYLLEELVKSGRRIIGFDLCEVSPSEQDDWDANVAARLLYKMSNLMSLSNKV